MGKFETALVSEVDRISKRTGLAQDKAFLLWFGTEILELKEDDAREAISVEGSNDKGIDLFWIDEDDQRVIFGQGKYSDRLSFKGRETDASKLESSLNWLVNPEALRREGKPELAGAAEDYVEALKNGYSTELWYFYAGPKSQNVEKHITVYNQNHDSLQKRRSFRHYPLELIQANWEELHGTRQRIAAATLKSLSAFEYSGEFGDAVVATVPASELLGLHKKYGEKLFERNVRLFLGARQGSVNAGLAETLCNPKERGNFWAYNNGITVLCDRVKQKGSNVEVKNFSIVNGCQTTVSLALSQDKLDKVAVLVRFIAASSQIVDDLIRYTNSQNAIRTWDIASQDKTQRRLKTEFAKLKKPYIYLTRRGDKPKGDLKSFRDENNKLRQISIDVIGQYAAAFRGDPVLAYKHKAFIFSKSYDDVFPPDIRVEEVLFHWICGEIAANVVRESLAPLSEEDTQYRILTKGETLFVLACMAKVACKRNGPTYLKSISEERVSSGLARHRIKTYAEYSKNAYVSAVSDLAELAKEELHTLIRQRDFWVKVVERVERSFERDAIAKKWLDEALPKLF
jgi:hypothetical protein